MQIRKRNEPFFGGGFLFAAPVVLSQHTLAAAFMKMNRVKKRRLSSMTHTYTHTLVL